MAPSPTDTTRPEVGRLCAASGSSTPPVVCASLSCTLTYRCCPRGFTCGPWHRVSRSCHNWGRGQQGHGRHASMRALSSYQKRGSAGRWACQACWPVQLKVQAAAGTFLCRRHRHCSSARAHGGKLKQHTHGAERMRAGRGERSQRGCGACSGPGAPLSPKRAPRWQHGRRSARAVTSARICRRLWRGRTCSGRWPLCQQACAQPAVRLRTQSKL